MNMHGTILWPHPHEYAWTHEHAWPHPHEYVWPHPHEYAWPHPHEYAWPHPHQLYLLVVLDLSSKLRIHLTAPQGPVVCVVYVYMRVCIQNSTGKVWNIHQSAGGV